MDLKELDMVNPQSHWYYRGKLFAIEQSAAKFAPDARSIIDVGAGSGFFSISLAETLNQCEVICVDTNYPADSVSSDGQIKYLRIPPRTNADIYLFMDVLEHVSNEVELISPYLEEARSGSVFIFTVPAFMSLWSPHDTYLEHYRRYRLPELCRLLSGLGLRVVQRRYLFGGVFPAAWALRRLKRGSEPRSDLQPLPAPINAILRNLTVTEHRLPGNRLAGVSALMVAVKE